MTCVGSQRHRKKTRVINRRILVKLLGIREESVILYLWGMNPLAYLTYFSILKLVYFILVHGDF
jgi:hypothetical protein